MYINGEMAELKPELCAKYRLQAGRYRLEIEGRGLLIAKKKAAFRIKPNQRVTFPHDWGDPPPGGFGSRCARLERGHDAPFDKMEDVIAELEAAKEKEAQLAYSRGDDSQSPQEPYELLKKRMFAKMFEEGERRGTRAKKKQNESPRPELPEDFFHLPDQKRLNRIFEYFVHREYNTVREAEWIKLAESQPACPDFQELAVGRAGAPVPKYGPWWKGEWRETPAVIAVTRDAVEHYLELSKNLVDPRTARETKKKFSIKPLSARMLYYAEIETERDRATVQIGLNWGYVCGNVCGWGFFSMRVVVIDTNTDKVLECHDQLRSTWVS